MIANVQDAALSMSPARLVQHFVEKALDARDGAALVALVSTDALRDCTPLLALLASFPDGHLRIEDLITEENLVAVRMTFRGTHQGPLAGTPPTGQLVMLPIFAMYRVSDQRIAEAWQGWDVFSLRAQIEDSEPILEMDEIQGNIFPGFNKDCAILLGFRIAAVPAARTALAKLADEVATAMEVFSFNSLFAALLARHGREGIVRATWCNAALAFPALRVFAADAERFQDTAFRDGMRARPVAALNGLPDECPDLLVIIEADDEDDLDDEAARCTAMLTPGFTPTFEQRGHTLPGPLRGHEHFGFRDGISQPGVRGRLPAPPFGPVTARLNPQDPNQGKPGQALVWPGEFISGYFAQDPGDPDRPGPLSDVGPEWARNGSFLVYARFRQDVGAFRRFVRDTAARLSATEPAFAGLPADRLGAMLMGRWASGAPLMRAPYFDDPDLGSDDCVNNNFSYQRATPPLPGSRDGSCGDHGFPPADGDPDGLVCPYPAHIRKANPRDDLRAAAPGEVQRHRMLRRGIPYGPPGEDDEDRGLLFLSYQTSIERQFEFLFSAWLDEPDLRAAGEGVDTIAGSATGFGLPVPDSNGRHIVSLKPVAPFSTLTGGGYFFAPSVSALRGLADSTGHES